MKLEFSPTDFPKILEHQISRKSVQWSQFDPCARTDGQAGGQTDRKQLIVAFHSHAKAPNNLTESTAINQTGTSRRNTILPLFSTIPESCPSPEVKLKQSEQHLSRSQSPCDKTSCVATLLWSTTHKNVPRPIYNPRTEPDASDEHPTAIIRFWCPIASKHLDSKEVQNSLKLYIQ